MNTSCKICGGKGWFVVEKGATMPCVLCRNIRDREQRAREIRLTLMKTMRYAVVIGVIVAAAWFPVKNYAIEICHSYGGFWSLTGCNR